MGTLSSSSLPTQYASTTRVAVQFAHGDARRPPVLSCPCGRQLLAQQPRDGQAGRVVTAVQVADADDDGHTLRTPYSLVVTRRSRKCAAQEIHGS